MLDPHALKIYVDGNCWKNPGGSGGFAARVEYPWSMNRDDLLVEYRGYFETNNNRMELRACIFAHEWAFENLEELPGRVQVVTDSSYVNEGYSRAIGWSQNDYCNSDGRPIKNEELWRELMTLRRKLARRLRIETHQIPRRSNEAAKEVDTKAKAAGKSPTHVDWGLPKGKIGRSKNNDGKAARLYPAAGQSPIICPYKSDSARRDIQRFKFQVYDEVRKDFFEKYEAYATVAIGNELHRGNMYHVRMNDVPRYPRILEIVESWKPEEFRAEKQMVSP
jgi:ribonuclease HI